MSGEEEGREAATATAAAANSSTKPWVEELPTIGSLKDSKDSAIRSARSLFHNSSTHLLSFQVSSFFFLLYNNDSIKAYNAINEKLKKLIIHFWVL